MPPITGNARYPHYFSVFGFSVQSLPKTCVARFNGNARDKDERRDAVFNVFVAGLDRDSNTAAGITRAYKTPLVGLPRDQQL
jgi:hypothetical protein